MISPNARLHEITKIVTGLSPVAPSSSVPDYVSLKGYERMTAIILGKNSTGVTGSAITLKQASAVANTGEKALAFDTCWANTDTGATDTLVETAVASNTFTTDNTNSKEFMYVLDVKPSDLDVANSFDCVRVGTGNATNSTLSVLYILWPARYAKSTPPAAITD